MKNRFAFLLMTLITCFCMSLTLHAQVSNDDCAGAIDLQVSPDETCGIAVTATTIGATASPQQTPCYGIADDDVWFSFVATSTAHTITLSNKSGSGADTYFQVLKGDCDNLTAILCSDWDSKVVPALTIGKRYYVRVYSYYADREVTFDICITTPDEKPVPPENDLCENAIALSKNQTVSGTTVNSTNQIGGLSGDVFYSYTGTGTEEFVTISLCGSSYDTFLAVYTNCGLKQIVSSDNDSCGDQNAKLTFRSDGSSTYIIVVDGFSQQFPFEVHGDFIINLTTDDVPPPPTDCSEQVIPSYNRELGAVIGGAENQKLAIDFYTGATGYQLYGFKASIIETEPATQFQFSLRSDADGIPGEVITTVNATIKDRVITTQNGGYDFVDYSLEFSTPLSLQPNAKYWLEMNSNAFAWEATSKITDIIGKKYAYQNSLEPNWNLNNDLDLVYQFICLPFSAVGCTSYETQNPSAAQNIGQGMPSPFYIQGGLNQRIELNVQTAGKYNFTFLNGTGYITITDSAGNIINHGNMTTNTPLPILFPNTGTYYLYKHLTSDCDGDSGTFRILSVAFVQALASNEIELQKISFYPNPVDDVLYISSKSPAKKIEIYTVAGQKLPKTFTVENNRITLRELPAGNYLVNVVLENGESQNIKIIKK